MRVKHPYIIPFIGLKLGTHTFEFELGDAFFADFEYSEISNADFQVVVTLEKKSTMMEVTMELTGSMQWPCDRCGETVEVPVSGTDHWVINHGDHTEDSEDDVWLFGPQEFQIDIRQRLFELAHLSLPARRTHDDGDCNEEVMSRMSEFETEDDSDSKWIALKNMKLENPSDQLEDDEDWDEDDE
ncbi:MAG: hypothetical protein RL106_170 [Bacteroidota bacterium]|jgi:uncharacterized metal-binding protein YceD (DUF177 family)